VVVRLQVRDGLIRSGTEGQQATGCKKTRCARRRGEVRRSHGGVTKRPKQLYGLALVSLASTLSTETGKANLLHRNPDLIELEDADPVQEVAAG